MYTGVISSQISNKKNVFQTLKQLYLMTVIDNLNDLLTKEPKYSGNIVTIVGKIQGDIATVGN